MTVEALIDQAINKARVVLFAWADDFLSKASYGELTCCELKLSLLNKWIGILEDYKSQNFGDNGAIEADYPCTTLEQINLLISKINALKC